MLASAPVLDSLSRLGVDRAANPRGKTRYLHGHRWVTAHDIAGDLAHGKGSFVDLSLVAQVYYDRIKGNASSPAFLGELAAWTRDQCTRPATRHAFAEGHYFVHMQLTTVPDPRSPLAHVGEPRSPVKWNFVAEATIQYAVPAEGRPLAQFSLQNFRNCGTEPYEEGYHVTFIALGEDENEVHAYAGKGYP